jgi:hypothetical protein
LRLAQQLLAALAAAHAQGVIHRDVKPANVMLTPSGQVKLTDFGVARVLDSGDATRTRGMIVGTVKYASPEQLTGLPLDGRSDLFSVGVLLYRLLARRHPFDGPNELAIMQKVLNENPPAPSTFNDAVDPGLDAVVLKALAKTPDQRHNSASEFSGALQPFLSGTPLAEPGTQPGVSTSASWTPTQTMASDETVRVATVAPVVGRRPAGRTAIFVALGAVVAVMAVVFVLMPRSGGGGPIAVVPPAASSPVAAVSSLDGRWTGHYLCSELLVASSAPNRGAFKADIVMQVSGRNVSWTRRSQTTLETMIGQIAADGRWSAEGVGENSARNDHWHTAASGVFNRKVSPPRFDGDLAILSADKAKLFRKCTLTAVREPS